MKNFPLTPKASFFPIFSILIISLLFSCSKEAPIFEEVDASETAYIHADNPGWDNADDCVHPNPVDISTDDTKLRTWEWRNMHIPSYSWNSGSSFGDGLHTDVAYDNQGVRVEGDHLRFRVHPTSPAPPSNAGDYNFRSEIRTAPWRIRHPLGTEQWIGWSYIFGDDYIPDHTSPITIYQNHPGISGLSPVFEITLAKRHNHLQNAGGEIELVNKGNNDRINHPDLRPRAGDQLDIVVHVIYGRDGNGLLEIWLNGELYYSKSTSTVYSDHQWGGNNKWGVYHHTFNDSSEDVSSSLEIGAGHVELRMGTLRMLTRTPDHPEYQTFAYDMVKP